MLRRRERSNTLALNIQQKNSIEKISQTHYKHQICTKKCVLIYTIISVMTVSGGIIIIMKSITLNNNNNNNNSCSDNSSCNNNNNNNKINNINNSSNRNIELRKIPQDNYIYFNTSSFPYSYTYFKSCFLSLYKRFHTKLKNKHGVIITIQR